MSFFQEIKKGLLSDFMKNSAMMLSSNMLSQIIAFCVYPILTRLFSKSEFGAFQIFFIISGFFTLLSTAQYNSAIILPKEKNKVYALFQITILINLILSIVLIFPFTFASDFIAELFNSPDTAPILPLLPVSVFLSGLWLSLNYFLIAQKRFKVISAYNISYGIATAANKISMGFISSLKSFGLILGNIFGQAIAIIICLVTNRKSIKKALVFNKKDIALVGKNYSNFPKFELPTQLIKFLSNNLPVLLMAMVFTNEEIGLFSLALFVGITPINLFCNSIEQVLYKKFRDNYNSELSIKKECLLFVKICLFFFLPLFVAFAFISKIVFAFLFGNEWIEAGEYFVFLLPWLFMFVTSNTLSFLPNLFFKQRMAMIIEIISIVFRLSSVLIGMYFENFSLTIIIFSATTTFFLIVKIFWYFKLVNIYEKKIIFAKK